MYCTVITAGKSSIDILVNIQSFTYAYKNVKRLETSDTWRDISATEHQPLDSPIRIKKRDKRYYLQVGCAVWGLHTTSISTVILSRHYTVDNTVERVERSLARVRNETLATSKRAATSLLTRLLIFFSDSSISHDINVYLRSPYVVWTYVRMYVNERTTCSRKHLNKQCYQIKTLKDYFTKNIDNPSIVSLWHVHIKGDASTVSDHL